ncbi:MAG: 1-(5-phosphoribosyl)-5-[(5-phosphoribosylamino)methylideneamino]imidazole-4-carboxamide isomerase [Dehalococcoidia bacterium]|nr:1-(5-phosphoribosyl)-5-[(5-phosphoribosylamino)methylideneamino]imidazole-4-carboxamide isomerase [Dehalococcoidia bacterium]
MDVIAAIDIRGGRCVRLLQGDYTRETVYADDPVEVARRWAERGAARLHVVDLDGAKSGRPDQQAVVVRLIESVPGVAVQVGGGIRRLRDAESYIEAGAARIVLGTAAIKEQETVLNACARFPDRVVVAIDARDGMVAAEAWHEVTSVAAVDLAHEIEESAHATRFLYTDIATDGTLAGPNVTALTAFIRAVSSPVIASGGVGSLADVEKVAATGAEAVVVGKALYEGRLSLEDAVRVALGGAAA